jgi:hypothetical protein
MIVDAYFDLIAVNATFLSLYNLSSDDLIQITGPKGNINLLKFVFSYNKVREMLAQEWHHLAYRNVMNFRIYSLQYRTTNYFQDLMVELRQHHLFNQYWQLVYLQKEDYFLKNRYINLFSPQWGKLKYYSTSLTSHGGLELVTYIPATLQTAIAFSQIVAEQGTIVQRLSSWPKL